MRPALPTALLALLLLLGAAGGEVRAQELPPGLAALEEERTERCVLEAEPPPTVDLEALLAENAAGLIELLETSRVAGSIRGAAELPGSLSNIRAMVDRYNRAYQDFVDGCRNDRNTDGVGCQEEEDLTELRAEIRSLVTAALEAEAERLLTENGSEGAGHESWVRDCADRLLLRPIVEESCARGGDAELCAMAARADAFTVYGADLRVVGDPVALWAWRPESSWSAFEPLEPTATGVRGGGTETVLQIGNVVATVRLGLDLVDLESEPERAVAARAFGAAFDMSFEAAGLTVLPVIEFTLDQDRPLFGETVYAFFVETARGPQTVLNAVADPEKPFSWVTPLRPEVAEWLQEGRTLWFTAGGPLPQGGMGPRFTVPFSTDGLGESVLDLAIYLTDGVFDDLRAIAEADRGRPAPQRPGGVP